MKGPFVEDPNTEQELSLRDYINVLIRRRYAVAVTFVSVCALVGGYTWFSRPVYRASFRMVVRNEQSNRRGFDLPLESLFALNANRDIQTQMQVLQGAILRNRILEKAKLPQGTVRLSVQQIGETDVLEVWVDSQEPKAAVKFARHLPEVYREYVIETRTTAVQKAIKFVNQRLAEERSNLTLAEQSLTAFRRQASVVDTTEEGRTSVAAFASLKDRLQQTEAALAGARAKLNDIERLRKRMPETVEKPVTATNQAERALIQDRISVLENQRAGLLIDYKPSHARVKAIDAQIAEYRNRLASLPGTVTTMTREVNPALADLDQSIATLRGEIASSEVAKSLLQAQTRAARTGMSRVAALEIEEAPLQRNVESARDMVKLLTGYLQELSLRNESVENPLEQVSSPPDEARQVAPRPLVNMAIAVLLGLALGLGIAALQEYFDDRINAGDEMRRILGAPVLAAVSNIKDQDARLITGKNRDSQLVETFRMLRTGVRFATVDSPATSLVITSSYPGEGKSLVATNLATSLALSGISVILVDTDLRRPSLHTKFDIPREPGLTTVLIGHCSLEEALVDVGIAGLRVLPTGPLPPNPAELLGSHAMRQLHAEMNKIADIVLFDSPPVMVAVDGLVLASECRGVIGVVDLERARKSEVQRLGEVLSQVNTRLLGVVLNKIPVQRRRSYGYGYRYGKYGNGKYGYGSGYGYGYGYGHGYGYGYGSDYSYGYEPKAEDMKAARGYRQEFEALPHQRDGGEPALPSADPSADASPSEITAAPTKDVDTDDTKA
ncbi:MAG: polysaccharide biosynthesis tyrosine autokinase [Chthonomonadales bacterium]|nr:polysaccharide biosynthesis tyrosine autokinase [Chthonomonadales bacterium]